jgi:hypothetical protein
VRGSSNDYQHAEVQVDSRSSFAASLDRIGDVLTRGQGAEAQACLHLQDSFHLRFELSALSACDEGNEITETSTRKG